MSTEAEWKADELKAQGILNNGGRDVLFRTLLVLTDAEATDAFVTTSFRLLAGAGDGLSAKELVELAILSSCEAVSARSIYWHLEAFGQTVDDEKLRDLTGLLREYLCAAKIEQAANAARALGAIGYRYDQVEVDFRDVLQRVPSDHPDFARFVLSAGVLRAMQPTALAAYIDDLLIEQADLDGTVTALVAHFGEPRHVRLLRERLHSDHTHQVLFAMLAIAVRHPEIRKDVAEVFLASPDQVRWGLDHYVYRFLDDPRIQEQYLSLAAEDAADKNGHLISINILKHSVRPAHLQACEAYARTLLDEQKTSLEAAVVAPSNYSGIYPTHETYVKENALFVASRLGILELRQWLPEAIRAETTPFLVSRMAEDCVFWEIPDFVVGLVPKMQENTKQSPMWLVSDEAGASGGAETLRALLESDGRVHGKDDALMTYVQGLAYAALNIGDVSSLLEAAEGEHPEWRRNAAAYAIREVSVREGAPKIDWDRVLRLLKEANLDEFTRHELLIATAAERPADTAALLADLPVPEKTKSRVLLARTLCNQDLEGVVKSIRQYLNPVQYPYSPSFEFSYAALTAARLYEQKSIDGGVASKLILNGLKHEAVGFFRACEEIRAGDEALIDVLWTMTATSNNSWSSYPSLWDSLARLAPARMTGSEVREHLTECGANAIKGYLDALLHKRELFVGNQSQIWEILQMLLVYQPRAVAWYAAYAASVLCTGMSRDAITEGDSDDDHVRRRNLELALWLDDETWQLALARANYAGWISVAEYSALLIEERERLSWADDYLLRTLHSSDLLRDWKYAQALLQVPSERVLQSISQLDAPTIAESFFLEWLHKHIEPALKKRREELWKKSRLPGEDSFPRGF